MPPQNERCGKHEPCMNLNGTLTWVTVCVLKAGSAGCFCCCVVGGNDGQAVRRTHARTHARTYRVFLVVGRAERFSQAQSFLVSPEC